MGTKEEVRKEIRRQKRLLDKEQIEEKSRAIFTKLESLAVWEEAQCIYAYVSYNQEVDTRTQMWKWLQKGKKVAVPKVAGDEIEFYWIKDPKELQKGYQGILEPVADQKADGKNGIILLPGLAFDGGFYRLGYGGGFYDRYLKKHDQLKRIALAYDFQIIESVPKEEHDETMDVIVGETSCLENRNRQ